MNSFQQVRNFLQSSLRLKMMLVVAGVLAVAIAVLIVDVTRRQRALLLEWQEAQARQVAQVMATSSSEWLSSHDLSGLQEMVEARRSFPELSYAMLLDQNGRVLAHTDRSRLGQYVQDLPKGARGPVLTRAPELVDVTTPVYLSGRHVGWVRLAFGQLEMQARLDENSRRGWLYATMAVAIGALMAGVVAARFTRRLYAIQAISSEVKQGRLDLRVADLGRDEAGRLGRDFNAMLDSLGERNAELQAANRRLADSQAEARRQMAATAELNVQLQQEGASRQRAEEATLLRSAALEAAATAIVITDRHGWIIWFNRAFTTLSGYTLDEARGKSFEPLINSGRQSREFYADLWETILAGRVWRGELINRRKDGRMYPEEMAITPLKLNGTEITHFIAIKQDVTQRKLDEEKQRAQEAHYRQAQKMEAVGRLAGGIAHDFNNLLTAIIGNAQLLRMGIGSPAAQAESLAQIDAAGQRAAGLTKQMLTFSRQQPVAFARVDLNEVVASMSKLLPRVLGEDIRIQFAYEGQPLLVDADMTMLDQVLMNVSVNARDAMPRGGTLTIATASVSYDEEDVSQFPEGVAGRFACLSLTDTGAGMEPSVLPHIFEPFFTTKEVGKGTGLGLATVHGIVEQHKGWIGLESALGVGTTFKIHLPLATTEVGAVPPEGPLLLNLGRGELILVVEDEESVRRIVTEVLALKGYRVIEASSGPEGLDLWRQRGAEVNMLLTDMVMPGGMDGQTLAAKILQEAPGLKVGYMSGYVRESSGQSPDLRSETNFLPKPFEVSQLARFVRRVLDH